jgi:transcriptional regulator with XRE-family HTH domain
MRNRHFIRRWREHRGLSQVDLAEKIGVDRAHVSRVENGRRPYSQEFLEAASLALGCSPADLLIRDPSDPEGLWAIYDKLGPQQRRQLMEIARTFLGAPSGPDFSLMAAAEPATPFVRDDET